jgi:RNA polymerase sigma-70 factor (ECF subfamily)
MCTSDEELMAAYVAGNDQALSELFDRYGAPLLRFFVRRGKRPLDAQDLVQETFLHLHRSRQDFRLGEPLRPWIFTLARNLGHDHGRRQSRRPESFCDLDVQADASDTGAALLCAERERLLRAALVRLSSGDRTLLDEHWFEERSFMELAARDGVHSTTLRVRAHRALLRLRTLIERAEPQALQN